MLPDAQRDELGPLIEEGRLKAKTSPKELRRTISAILRRHQNGAKWRAIPEESDPWWQAAQIFIRRARAGVWERLVRERGVSVAQAARDLDVHETMLHRWVKQAAADPQHAFPGQGR